MIDLQLHIGDEEYVYRFITDQAVKVYDLHGKFSASMFNASDFVEISVDRALRVSGGPTCMVYYQVGGGVAQLHVGTVRLHYDQLNDKHQRPTGKTFLANVVSDPILEIPPHPANPAHSLVVLLPEAHRRKCELLQAYLARIAKFAYRPDA